MPGKLVKGLYVLCFHMNKWLLKQNQIYWSYKYTFLEEIYCFLTERKKNGLPSHTHTQKERKNMSLSYCPKQLCDHEYALSSETVYC